MPKPTGSEVFQHLLSSPIAAAAQSLSAEISTDTVILLHCVLCDTS